MNCKIDLGDKLDTASVAALFKQLAMAAGQPVTLDGSKLKVVGGLAAQLLVAANRRWQSEGNPFLISASESLIDDLRRMDLHTNLQTRGNWE